MPWPVAALARRLFSLFSSRSASTLASFSRIAESSRRPCSRANSTRLSALDLFREPRPASPMRGTFVGQRGLQDPPAVALTPEEIL